MFFCERISSKENPIGFRGPVIIEKHILSSEPPEVAIRRYSKTFLNGGELSKIYFLGFLKKFRTSIFLSTSEGLLLNIPDTKSSLLWIFIFSISHFSSLETMYKSSRLQLFFKIGVLKNFAIFTGKHLCWSLFLIKPSGLQLY